MKIDWAALAREVGSIRTDGSEYGGRWAAEAALVDILGDDVIRDAVDLYLSGEPGYELARSVLNLLKPRVAMEQCLQLVGTEDEVDAMSLLRACADRSVLQSLPQLFANDNANTRCWAIMILDQLLFSGYVKDGEVKNLIDKALADPHEGVRELARRRLVEDREPS
jgi:hypothetical protein